MRRKALASAIHSNCVASREIREDIDSLLGFDMLDPQWRLPVVAAVPVEYSQEDMDKMLALIKTAMPVKPTLTDFMQYSRAPNFDVLQGVIMPWRLIRSHGM